MDLTKKMMKQLKLDAYTTSNTNFYYKGISNITNKGHCELVYMKKKKK